MPELGFIYGGLQLHFLIAQTFLKNDDVLAADEAVNTWHFRTDATGTVDQDAADIQTRLLAFWATMDGDLSPNVLGTAGLGIKIYNHEDTEPRVPIINSLNNLVPGAVQAMPPEVAACLSYRKTPISGQDPQRSRGRIYFGPLGTQWLNSAIIRPEMDPVKAQKLADAGFDVKDFVGPIGGSEIWWSVFSRMDALGRPKGSGPGPAHPTFTAAELNLGYHTIEQVWVDNAFDIQRRRGLEPNIRYTGV